MKKLYIISDKIIKILVIILSITALINMLIIKDNMYINIDMKKIIVMILFILLLIIFLNSLRNNVKIGIKAKKIIKTVFCIFLLIIQIVYVNSIYRLIGFDPIRLYTGAFEIVNNSKLGIVNLDYFSTYNNNIFLLIIYVFIFKIVNIFNFKRIVSIFDYAFPLTIFNIIIVDFSILVLYKILKKY